MSRELSKSILLIVDDMPLRRAQAKAFLLDWATRRNFVIVDKTLSEAIEWSPQKHCRLIFLSIQTDDALQDKYSAAIRLFSALHGDVPLAVVADGLVNAELALLSGAAGYIPTSLQEDVVLAALDFLLAGGSFFPKELLCRVSSEPIEPRQGRLSAPALFNRPGISRIESSASASDGASASHIDCISARSCPSSPVDVGASDHGGEHGFCRLTPRQTEVLDLLRRGQSNKHIARELDMSEATVKVHVRQVMKRLGATNRTQAAVMAFPAQDKEKQPRVERDHEAWKPTLKLAVAPSLVAAQ